jgi:hypothetical protein
MWMQPVPADHAGPVRMGLRDPVGTSPLCRVASHALFGPWLRGGSPPVPDRRKLPESTAIASGNFRKPGKSHRHPDRPHCGPGGVQRFLTTDYTDLHGWCFAPIFFLSVSIRVIRGQNSRRGTSILRITPRSRQHQVIRSRRSSPRGPGTSHPLSRNEPGAAGSDSSPSGPTIKPSTSQESRTLVPTERQN